MTAEPRRVLVVQDGARLHYAVPLALQQEGLLDRVATDWASAPRSVEEAIGRLVSAISPAAGARLLGRWRNGLRPGSIVRNPLMAIRHHALRRRFRTDEEFFEYCSGEIADWVIRRGFGRANTLFGFVRNIHPRLLCAAHRRGLTTITDQIIAPAATEQSQFEKELACWPGWHPGGAAGRDLRRVDAFERATWSKTDALTCGSNYVKRELIAHGISPDRVSVIPYPVPLAAVRPHTQNNGKIMTVGFVGAVGLRKGAGYFAAVARRLAGPQIRFVMVGPIHLTPPGERTLRDSGVTLVGQVPRSEVSEWLSRIDIFLFPSTCEGSATAIMEAMAAGLSVICSPESGSVITDGVDGFIRDYDDEVGMAEAIRRLDEAPEIRAAISSAARTTASRLNQAYYAEDLCKLIRNREKTKSSKQ